MKIKGISEDTSHAAGEKTYERDDEGKAVNRKAYANLESRTTAAVLCIPARTLTLAFVKRSCAWLSSQAWRDAAASLWIPRSPR